MNKNVNILNALTGFALCFFLNISVYANTYKANIFPQKSITKLIFTCPNDNDCDGVIDNIDLDDDNDGILDINEFNYEVNFITNGSARLIGGNRYQITEDKRNESGSIILSNLIDFNFDFNFSLSLNFGNKDNNGADGMALIFHNDPNGLSAIGQGGGSLGTVGIRNGLYFEIDTYFNGAPLDIEEDHTSLSDSDFAFSSPSKFVTQPVAFSNIEDGNDHALSVSWVKSSQTFTFTLDGVVGAQLIGVDVVNNYFDGSSNIYFGITASTGLFTNEHFLEDFFFGDIDQDRIINSFDLDSDNDGCPDVIESGGDDPDGDNALGSLPLNVDSDGLVISADSGNGYNGLAPEYIEYTASKIEIEQISDEGLIISGKPAKFTAIASLLETNFYTGIAPNTLPDYTHPTSTKSNIGLRYQWYLEDPSSGGVILSNDLIYSGVDTNELSIVDTTNLLGNEYFVEVTHDKNPCSSVLLSTTLQECNIDFEPTITNLSCEVSTGSIAVTNVTGGSGSYEYSKDGGANWQTDPDFNDLAIGPYDVAVKDVNSDNCFFVKTAVIAHDDIDAGYENTTVQISPEFNSIEIVENEDIEIRIAISVANSPPGSILSQDLQYQWYLGNPNNGGIQLADNLVYNGSKSGSLIIKDVDSTFQNNEYYAVVTHKKNRCIEAGSITKLTFLCIEVYDVFTPNNDRINDHFKIKCIENYPESTLSVYNRWGNLVYESKNYQNDWDGTSYGSGVVIAKGNGLPSGIYYYIIDFGNGQKDKVGYLTLVR